MSIGETPESDAVRRLLVENDRLRDAIEQLQRALRDHESRITALES